MNYDNVIDQIARVQRQAQSAAARAVNQWLTLRNWLIGAYIVEYEQNGEDRAAYGSRLFAQLATDLRQRGVSGFSASNLKNFRQFALLYPHLADRATPPSLARLLVAPSQDAAEIRQTLSGELANNVTARLVTVCFPALETRASSDQLLAWQDASYYEHLFAMLSWSHLLELTRIDDPLKRAFYELECVKSRWSLRELKRQINSMLYERIGLSKDKEAVMALAAEGRLIDRPSTVLRDPYVLEFLELAEQAAYSESELEQALIDHLARFLHELGRDFCFIGRQFRITVAGRHHYLDLLFYHRALRCLIALDLKLGAFQHEYVGQMNFYLNYLKERVSHPDENPPVGLILCAEKDSEEVYFATAGMDQQLFVSRYLVALPSEEQLKKWLREEQEQLQRMREIKEDANGS
jgi:predicted nuclease of restriction endonuclease-like (RecB) superfamily